MTILIICCATLTLAYAALMLLYRIGWNRQAVFQLQQGFIPRTKISVVIPARNEAANIAACLKSLLAQDYPQALLEIIVVDDHSEDETAAIAASFKGVQVLSLKKLLQSNEEVNAFKKKALSAAIMRSTGKLIVTTDADCTAQPLWLKNIAALFEKEGAAMIIGPVAFVGGHTLLHHFQSLDFTMMQGITAASHRLRLGGMANGANLTFSRSAFDAVGGYSGTEHFASGDDYLLLHKIQRSFSQQVHYLKSLSAIVSTTPQPTWGAFLNQRIRWASKNGKYPDSRLTLILAVVFCFNICLLSVFGASFWYPQLWFLLAALLLIKIVAELVLLHPVSRFFGNERELPFFPPLQPLHIAYINLAGFLGMKGSYRWKGRQVK